MRGGEFDELAFFRTIHESGVRALLIGRRSLHDRRLTPAEARAYLDAPLTELERENVLALVAWFRRRYPTPLDRLAYVRRAYARWQRTRGLAARARTRSPDAAGRREEGDVTT